LAQELADGFFIPKEINKRSDLFPVDPAEQGHQNQEKEDPKIDFCLFFHHSGKISNAVWYSNRVKLT
jgi:hypothetical protein